MSRPLCFGIGNKKLLCNAQCFSDSRLSRLELSLAFGTRPPSRATTLVSCHIVKSDNRFLHDRGTETHRSFVASAFRYSTTSKPSSRRVDEPVRHFDKCLYTMRALMPLGASQDPALWSLPIWHGMCTDHTAASSEHRSTRE